MIMTVPMSHHRLTCLDPQGKHEIVYTQWGDPNNQNVVLCVHGLLRNRRDFDHLAMALATEYRVICPDLPGRGDSDWLSQPEAYTSYVYIVDMVTLLAEIRAKQTIWIGTSLGGLIGMMLASQSQSPISHLILNDIGPLIPQTGLTHIANKLKNGIPSFPSLEAVEQFFRTVHSQFGPLTTEQWQHLARHGSRLAESGLYHLAYDPKVAYSFQDTVNDKKAEDIELWAAWQAIHCPILLLHGEKSALLLPEIIEKMQVTKPEMKKITFPEVGHAPALMAEEQIMAIRHWLDQHVKKTA